MLQIHYSNDSSKDEKITVFAGKTFTAGGYKFIVNSVDTDLSFMMIPGSSSGSVTLSFDKI